MPRTQFQIPAFKPPEHRSPSEKVQKKDEEPEPVVIPEPKIDLLPVVPAPRPILTSRAGGVYIPPHKLKALQEELMKSQKNTEQYQRLMWEMLRKSINGVINKVNVVNLQHIIIELLNENILRGKGL